MYRKSEILKKIFLLQWIVKAVTYGWIWPKRCQERTIALYGIGLAIVIWSVKIIKFSNKCFDSHLMRLCVYEMEFVLWNIWRMGKHMTWWSKLLLLLLSHCCRNRDCVWLHCKVRASAVQLFWTVSDHVWRCISQLTYVVTDNRNRLISIQVCSN